MSINFGFWSEQETQVGQSYARRLHELVDEAVLAEKMGFDLVSLSEQHLALGGISSSAPEVVYGYLAAKTSRIRLRPSVVLMPKNFNHALRTAERAAVIDILSNGRYELYCGRANTTIAMRGFNVDPSETQEQMEEGMDLIREAFTNDVFTFKGKHYQVPPRMLVPKPLQKPYPAMGIAATSERSHAWAGEQGLAVMSHSLYKGWDVQSKLIEAYKSNWRRDPTGPLDKPRIGMPLFIGIGNTDQEAYDTYSQPLKHYARISTSGYPKLAQLSKDYAYMAEGAEALQRAAGDWDYLINESASLVCGSPDTVIRQLERYVDLGIDEILFHLDSVPHAEIMKAIDLIGRHVIPYFKDRNNVVRDYDDVLEQIRSMREPAAAA
ncbi:MULTISPECIES: LLM class flavin-dependent oxidoreductase [unclassified Sphingomonas]|uniref:LLM class flavin-dependent oxidoreductase n=1 Tax=unclassified Sphingomonas TaxID=196159 RepID=UPI0006F89E5A|nr:MULTISPECIES: LLM class flavin-dependent oxidoreductase [unclassified Sphingomonas]KQX18570.1 luciferase [Sphingomonas sp. Root1294]KQY72106.1 luciferase [Sphingomonas sp. Root50]KRB94624.1 luciferase [Sphingomonas sp. Root720]